MWHYDSPLDEAGPLKQQPGPLLASRRIRLGGQRHSGREPKLGSLARSATKTLLNFWTTSQETRIPSHLQIEKPGAHSFVKSLKYVSQRREVRAAPGPRGAAFSCKVSPSIPVTKMNMEKIITFKTYLILEHIISTCRKRMLSEGIFPISLIKLLS